MAAANAAAAFLLLAEGLAVGAGLYSGVGLMGTHQDPLQRAVVCVIAVVCALRNSTLDALVCMATHRQFLLFCWYNHSIAKTIASIQEKFA